MKIKLSKSQWEQIGKKAGWMKKAQGFDITEENSATEGLSKEQIIKEVTENLPDYSINLICTGWKYSETRFSFMNEEDGKKYVIGLPELLKGYDILAAKVAGKKLFFDGLDIGDPGSWDADSVDALVQCAIFGDVIYG